MLAQCHTVYLDIFSFQQAAIGLSVSGLYAVVSECRASLPKLWWVPVNARYESILRGQSVVNNAALLNDLGNEQEAFLGASGHYLSSSWVRKISSERRQCVPRQDSKSRHRAVFIPCNPQLWVNLQ